MGITTTDRSLENKRIYKSIVDEYQDFQPERLSRTLTKFLSPDAEINVVHPFKALKGPDAFVDVVLMPMVDAFDHFHRRTDMLFGGIYEDHEWVVGHGHFVGLFRRPWLGIPPSGDITWLHYVEFHRMAGGRAVETYLYIDMLDLLRQLERYPLASSIGYEGFVPGPATGDGVLIDAQGPEASAKSLALIDGMLSRLYTEDEGWRPYWHRNMYWYGPSGYGSQIGVDGFRKFQHPYEAIFDADRVRTNFRRSGDEVLDAAAKGHFTRFGDGNYAALGGWPSHGGFLVSDWLGAKADGQMFTVRVADLYRRSGDLIVENWVFVDIIDMMLQLGVDLFANAGVEIRL